MKFTDLDFHPHGSFPDGTAARAYQIAQQKLKMSEGGLPVPTLQMNK